MASKLIRIEDRAGRRIAVYESGLERDAESGRIVKPAPGTLVTRENSTVYHRARQEKLQRQLRRRIAESARAGMPPGALVRDSADAFAESGAMLFEQVVMNSEAYPRDRLEAWKELRTAAGLAPGKDDEPGAGAGAGQGLTAGLNAATAVILSKLLADVAKMQEKNPVRVVDVEPE